MDAQTYYCYFDSPLGRLCIEGDGQFVTGLYLPNHKGWRAPGADCLESDQPFAVAREQLAEYFAGRRQAFDVPVQLTGSTFQRRVWQELARIPYGTTINYAQLAERIGQPNAARAVGNANGRNPISIIIPCHRVIGANGKLTGYAGGIERKSQLLAWERATLSAERSLFATSPPSPAFCSSSN